jgi:hypothetical protein
MKDIEKQQEYLTEEFGDFIGLRLMKIRPMLPEELEAMYWDDGYGDVPMVLVFSNGSCLIPSQDPEGNGPGWLFVGDPIE